MAIQSPYRVTQESLEDGTITIDWEGAGASTIKAAWVTSVYTPNQDVHAFWSDAVANEVSGTGYTAGGETLANLSVTRAAGVITVTADDPSWAQNAAGFANGRYLIIYADTGVAATSPLVSYTDAVSDVGNVAGPLNITIPVTGIFQKTVTP